MNNNTFITPPIISNESIRNFSFAEFIAIFNTSSLDISNFWLINSGYDAEGNKKFIHVIIRACQIRPFFGPHLISLVADEPNEPMRTFWVTSLTHLRRNLFSFTDRLSFERSTYIVPYEDNSLMIRIKAVRSFLTIPQKDWSGRVLRQISQREIVNAREDISNPNEVRNYHLLDSSLQQMITFISREKNNNQLEESIKYLRDYVNDYCDKLHQQIINTTDI